MQTKVGEIRKSKVVDTSNKKGGKKPGNEKISIFYCNVQGITNKLQALECFIQGQDIKIICLAEHFLVHEQKDLYVPENYTVKTIYCRKKTRQGGTVIYTHKNISCKKIKVKQFCVELHYEVSAVLVNKLKTIILVIYRSSSHGIFNIFYEKLQETLVYLNKTYKEYNIILCGDFNVHFEKENDKYKLELVDLIKSFNLRITVDAYTRVTKNTKSCIDNVITNTEENNINVTIVQPHLGDHHGLLIEQSYEEKNDQIIKKMARPMTKKGYEKFIEIIGNIDWTEINNVIDVRSAYTKFHYTITSYINECFPEKLIAIKEFNTWYDNNLKNIKKKLDLIYKLKSETRSDQLENEYKTLKKEYRKRCVEGKRKEIEDKILNTSPKKKSRIAWKILNKQAGKTINKMKITMDVDINDLNTFFVQIGKNSTENLPETNKTIDSYLSYLISPLEHFIFSPTTPNEIIKTIKTLKNTESMDFYCMNTKLLKEITYLISNPLSTIINKIFDQAIFPSELKITKVIPIPKKTKTTSYSDIRPISLIPILAKVVEKVMLVRLTNYFEGKNIFSTKQFGFRKGKSTTQAILHLIDQIMDNTDKHLKSTLTLMDLSKAFDSINHEFLLKKLYYYGIRDKAYNLLKSYLSERTQVLNYSGKTSNQEKITTGVPQGSLLGPFLFLVFINDLPSNIKSDSSALFADDTTYLNAGKCDQSLADKNKISESVMVEWCNTNLLKCNEDKTQQLKFSFRAINPAVGKLLGIHIDERLSWAQHIDKISNKLTTVLYQMRKLSTIISSSTLKNFYHACFGSIIAYGAIVWGFSVHANRIFILQKQAIRILDKISPRESCRNHFKQLNIMTFPSIVLYQTLINVKTNITSFEQNKTYHNYNTRNKDQLRTQLHNFKATQLHNKYMGIKYFNLLPEHIKRLNLDAFKSKLKEILIETELYDIKEFETFVP